MPDFHAQAREDQWVHEHCGLPEKGVFVDIGASDGDYCSNTKHFEDKGWTGICFEPDPRLFPDLQKNRKCITSNCAVTTGEKKEETFHLNKTTWSGFRSTGDTVTVPTTRLDTALRAAGIEHIDLLSIDTEGTELDVWNSFDWKIWRPSVVIIEVWTQNVIDTEKEVREVFSQLPWEHVHLMGGNLIYYGLK